MHNGSPLFLGFTLKTPGFAALSVRGIRGSARATVGGHPAFAGLHEFVRSAARDEEVELAAAQGFRFADGRPVDRVQ